MKRFLRQLIDNSIVWLMLLACWHIFSFLVSNEMVLPGPYTVFILLSKMIVSGSFWTHLFITLSAIIVSGCFSFILSLTMGYLVTRSGYTPKIIWKLNKFIFYVPSIIITYLVVLSFGFGYWSMILILIVILTPELVIILVHGYRRLDKKFTEFCYIYHVPKISSFMWVIFPQLEQTLLTMIKTELAVGWKVVLIVEIFSQARGVGYMINESFSTFSVAKVLAWFIGFLIIMIPFEQSVVWIFSKSIPLFRKRRFNLL